MTGPKRMVQGPSGSKRFSSVWGWTEKIVARPDFAPTLNQLERPQPAKSIIEAAAIRFVTSLGRHFLFA